MEKVNCVVCSSPRNVPYIEKDSFNIVRCTECGMVYVNPRLTLEELEDFYETHYHEYLDTLSFDVERKKGAINWIRKYQKTGRLLDVGCSVGAMLEAARPYFETSGIEVASWALEEAQRRGFNVLKGALEDANFEREMFAVITFTEVIEHIHNPVKFLNEVNRILRPGGIIYLTTGNIEGWRARRDGKKWYYLNPQFHLSYFSPATIREILRRTGFELLARGGLFRLRDMLPLWRYYPNKLDFIKGCIGKISFADLTLGDMGVIARKRALRG